MTATKTTCDKGRPPTFVFIGGQRCGSGWVHRCLSQHPQVYTAEPKELHFFDRHFDKGITWYHSRFEPSPVHLAWGEATPSYIADKLAPRRLAAIAAEARLIAVLREPITRAYSIYQLKRNTSLAYETFEQAIAEQPDILQRGLYADQLERWYSYFPKEQLLVMLYDDLVTDARSFIRRIYLHIGVNPDFVPTWVDKTYNAVIMPRLRNQLRHLGMEPLVKLVGKSPLGALIRRRHRSQKAKGSNIAGTIDPKTIESLADFYREPNKKLAALLEIDISHWESSG